MFEASLQLNSHMKKFIYLIFLLNSFAQSLAHAETLHELGEVECVFQGPITNREILNFQRALNQGCKTVFLNTNGGNVEAALAMGRAIRRVQATVVVPSPGVCASACVFLYAGGVIRLPYSEVKIHRPYTLSVNNYSNDADEARKITIKIKTFLQEMNVDESLLSKMMRIPPEEAISLSFSEMEDLGLGQTDRVFQHYLDKKEASARGMSTQDLLAAKRRLNKMCGSRDKAMQPTEFKSVNDCWDSNLPLRK